MSAKGLSLAVAALVLSTGCHAKFKDAVPGIDAVNVQVLTTGGPFVQLGYLPIDDEGMVSEVINVVQTVRSAYQTDRIEDAVIINDVQDAMTQGVAETLNLGVPFSTTANDPNAPLLQIEVTSYGLFVPVMGATGEFTVTAKARIYEPDGERVYRKNLTCSLGMDADGLEAALPIFNNAKALDEMSDAEINNAFADMAWLCGQQLVMKMRQHAG